MSKVSLEIVAEVLSSNNIETDVLVKMLKDMERQAQIEAEEAKELRDPPMKKQFVVVISDPRGQLPADEDLVGWVAQIPELDNPGVTIERIKRCAYEFNISKKGSKRPAKSIGEACEVVSAKIQKEQGVFIKTKTPVTVLKTDNKLPTADEIMDESGLG